METYKKLPKKFKAKWIAALRSGEYKQSTNSRLHDYAGYCCLGVAGVICGLSDDKLKELGGLFKNGKQKNIPKLLQEEVIEQFKTFNPVVNKLVHMNDSGKTFPEIADWIEENL